MPIYAYKCESCGFAKDVLQKMSATPLTDCPECGAASFKKQLTSAGFQLKGSGWYVTDFRGGDSASAAKGKESSAEGGGAESKAADSSTAAPAAASTAAPAAPASTAAAPAPTKAAASDTTPKSS